MRKRVSRDFGKVGEVGVDCDWTKGFGDSTSSSNSTFGTDEVVEAKNLVNNNVGLHVDWLGM